MATVSYKCPNCNGGLEFEPQTQKFMCPYCKSDFSKLYMDTFYKTRVGENPHAEEIQEEPQKTQRAGEKPTEEDNDFRTVLYNCPSCGAEVATDETTAATICYYCHNPVVLSGRLEGNFKPDQVIPFKVSKEHAVEQFLSWTRKKKYIPADFFNKSQIDKMTGVYFPFWVGDSAVDGDLQATATKVNQYRRGDYEITQTNFYSVERGGTASFENIVQEGLNKENSKLITSVHPYDMADIEPFSPSYLTGFQAQKRNVESDTYTQAVQKAVEESTKKMLRDAIGGYSSVRETASSIGNSRLDWKYTLFPVWTLTYRGDDKNLYYYTMNGQTGKVTGKLPLDEKKLKRKYAIISAVTFLIMLLGLWGGKSL